MNMKVVKNQQHLKRRIDDFFLSGYEGKAARVLIDTLAEHNRAWIFGGMIRDIGLFGHKGFTSDIDIVVDSNHEDLLRVLSTIDVQNLACTKLGGIRFHYHDMDFDVWCLSDTWAFKENIIPLEGAHSLFKTTLMTWDAILYDIHSREVISPENYLDDLHERRLELVLSQTPNEPGSLIKILRTIYSKRVEVLGPELCTFLHQRLYTYNFDALMHYEMMHYHTNSFTAAQINQLLQCLRLANPASDLRVNINPT